MLKAINLLLEWMLFKTASSIFLTEQKIVSLIHGSECLNHLVEFNLNSANFKLNLFQEENISKISTHAMSFD